MSEEKRNIHALIEKEAPSLNNLLDPNDVKEFKEMTKSLEILGQRNKCLELKQK
jgi:hypothetical protein